MLRGPQGEPLLTDAELRELPDSAVASGTDRDIVNSEKAVLIGPQGELIYPSLDVLCPTCGQPFREEACSQPGAEPDGFEDPDNAVADDRDDLAELLRSAREKLL
jgi:hypothetical protein